MVELVNMLLYLIMNLKGTQYGSELMTSTSVLVQTMLTRKNQSFARETSAKRGRRGEVSVREDSPWSETCTLLIVMIKIL